MNSPIDHCDNCTVKKGSWLCVGCEIKLPIDAEPIILNRVVKRYPDIWKIDCPECHGHGGDSDLPESDWCTSCKGEGWVYNYLTPEQYKAQTGFEWIGVVWTLIPNTSVFAVKSQSQAERMVAHYRVKLSAEKNNLFNPVIFVCGNHPPPPDDYIPEATDDR